MLRETQAVPSGKYRLSRPHREFSSGKKLTILFLLIFAFTDAYPQNWYSLGGGLNSEADAVVYYYHYPGGGLITGGLFSNAGGVHVNKIAAWFDGHWAPLGSGIDSTPYGQVRTLLVVNSDLYAGGTFSYAGGDTAAQNIARWDGSAWHPLGNGLYGGVHALILRNGLLFAGGDFSNVRYGVPARFIAQWNIASNTWDTLAGGNNLDGWINALTIYNGQIIAGGAFTHSGGVSINHIAQWNGSAWTPLGSGVDGAVFTLKVYNGNLIAGGNFTHAGGLSTSFIALWSGSDWSPLGAGLNGAAEALAIFNNNLVAGTFGGTPYYLYKWNGSSWAPLGGGTNGNVYGFYADNYSLFTAGQFTIGGGVTTNYVAEYTEPGTIFSHKNGLNKPIVSHQTTRDSTRLDSTGGHYDVNSSYYITDVNLTIDTVNYPGDSDLEFHLVHQSVTDTLIYQVGGNGANFTGTILNDSASTLITNGSAPFTGSFRPNKPLTQFNGQDPGGDWILEIYDRGTGNTGILEAWTLNITYGINPIGIQPTSSEIPKSFNLMQNYPNPFNPSTKINFALPKAAFVRLTIYDILGREVTTLVNEQLKSGSYEAEWNAGNLSSGVYFYRLVVGENTINGGFTQTKKMVLIK